MFTCLNNSKTTKVSIISVSTECKDFQGLSAIFLEATVVLVQYKFIVLLDTDMPYRYSTQNEFSKHKNFEKLYISRSRRKLYILLYKVSYERLQTNMRFDYFFDTVILLISYRCNHKTISGWNCSSPSFFLHICIRAEQ